MIVNDGKLRASLLNIRQALGRQIWNKRVVYRRMTNQSLLAPSLASAPESKSIVVANLLNAKRLVESRNVG